jgi:tRNA (mo5U34)-methyltransferase
VRNGAEIQLAIAGHSHWYHHRIELALGIVTPGTNDCEQILASLDLAGKRVLDIGTWDGFFSFVCERRGAEVVVDYMPAEATGFSDCSPISDCS